MKYIFSLADAYGQLQYIVAKYDTQLEFSVFSDIIFNYVQAAVRRWYFGFEYNKNMNMLTVGLSHYLSKDEVDNYLLYLDTIFWPNINNSIVEDVSKDTMVLITIKSEGSIMLEIKSERTPLEIIIDRVCVEVEHKIYSGEYIDPTLKEIYNASRTTPELSD